jgi:hypothetical protein
MSEEKLIPVSPARDTQGRILSLLPFVDGKWDDALPYPSKLTEEDRAQRKMVVNFFQTSASTAAKLGIMGALSTSSNYLYDAAVFEILIGTHKIRSGDVTNYLVRETFWGSSIRIAMRIKALDVKAAGGFGLIAASVELGTAQVEYEITTLGTISPFMLATALEGMPLFGTLNFDAYTQFTEAAESIAHQLMDEAGTSVVPVAVKLKYHPPQQSMIEALSKRYAMIAIIRTKNLTTALKEAPKDLDPFVIKDAYWQVLAGANQPLETHAETARSWLNA